ncbi:peptidoglycan/xylan/chitin deacetylase (PgdA/CDA1 family) [Clostridium algifaecis]|uniref:Peptidoglycan/xylan/chitin deacetylase (PgdA/CDA1 family) n=1 Tax=Clostridium algifaecis TaxID=1472040 RepID=A0ABS4KQC3_9CLOT|nr:polysaccharide deacetylase family protein [Clostridium algifaecis]MBP2032243.1 peptidoglycan/xylan/chitin deacetylase (PgdA/CDA1 family) [Clostridium algifaecis]
MSKKRSKNGRVVGFIVIIIAALFLSSFGGFEFAEKQSNSRAEKIAAASNDAAKDKAKKEAKEAEEKLPPNAKVAYLTFDDGPSANVTPRILNTLKQNNIKATFFILGSMAQQNPGLLKQEKAAGHTIGNHTYSHEYKYLYSSTDNFINDLKKNETIISSIIGDHDKTLIRFPGGSFKLTSFQRAATAAGYHYIDWNAETGDAERQHASVDFLLTTLRKEIAGQKKVVILMHDAATKSTTADALPQVIAILKSQGYQFRPITSDSYNVIKR